MFASLDRTAEAMENDHENCKERAWPQGGCPNSRAMWVTRELGCSRLAKNTFVFMGEWRGLMG